MIETEADWISSACGGEMLESLTGKASDRKLRLFACACCRLTPVTRLLRDERDHRAAVEVCERHADGLAGPEELVTALRGLPPIEKTGGSWNAWHKVKLSQTAQAELTVRAALADEASDAAWATARASVNLLGPNQSDLVREIFGNPFRALNIETEWSTPVVIDLARSIYDSGVFDRMPELGDALALEGCDDPEILGHCRSRTGHFRGCWVADVLLGKS